MNYFDFAKQAARAHARETIAQNAALSYADENAILRGRLAEIEASRISLEQLTSMVVEMLLVREGEPVSAELALERARNISLALAGMAVEP